MKQQHSALIIPLHVLHRCYNSKHFKGYVRQLASVHRVYFEKQFSANITRVVAYWATNVLTIIWFYIFIKNGGSSFLIRKGARFSERGLRRMLMKTSSSQMRSIISFLNDICKLTSAWLVENDTKLWYCAYSEQQYFHMFIMTAYC